MAPESFFCWSSPSALSSRAIKNAFMRSVEEISPLPVVPAAVGVAPTAELGAAAVEGAAAGASDCAPTGATALMAKPNEKRRGRAAERRRERRVVDARDGRLPSTLITAP